MNTPAKWDSRPRLSLVLQAPSLAEHQAWALDGLLPGEGAGPTTRVGAKNHDTD